MSTWRAVRLANLESKAGAGWAVLSVLQQELGEMTRLTRNAVDRILDELVQTGLVGRRYRRLKIPDLAKLQRAAGGPHRVDRAWWRDAKKSEVSCGTGSCAWRPVFG